MTKEQYHNYLTSDDWKAKRERRLAIDDNKCCVCGSGDLLNVHHLTYKNVTNENVDTDLATLCRACHITLHRVREIVDVYAKDGLHFLPKLKEALVYELWMRDISNGGNMNIFDSGMRMTGKLIKIISLIYPEVPMWEVNSEIKSLLVLIKNARIIGLYHTGYSIDEIARKTHTNNTNIYKILKKQKINQRW